MRKIKYEDDSFAIGKGWASLSSQGTWLMGVVVTPCGIVDVYKEAGLTRLDIAYRGRLYTRSYREALQSRTLTSFAKRFAKEITDEKG